MSATRARLAVGLLLLAVAAALGARVPAPERVAREPLARSLVPLGPLKPILSAALWYQLLRSEIEADGERFTVIAEALLELHPGLDSVREHLALQMILTESRRAPDAERRQAFVARGLAMLDEGLELADSPRLHLALAEVLVDRDRRDPMFALTVERTLGDEPRELAIDHLRRSGSDQVVHAALLGAMLVERGVRSLVVDGRVRSARRDLSDAQESLQPVWRSAPREAEQIVRPLRELLEQVDAGADPRDLDPLRSAWQDAPDMERS